MQYLTPDDYSKAEKNGIDRKMLYARFYVKGWSIERATTEKPIRRTSRKHQNGYEKYKETCEMNGISYSIYAKRIQRGWSQERAAFTPAADSKTKVKRMLEARGIIHEC